MREQELTVIIPTYTGVEHLPGVFDSLLAQNGKHSYETVVVIDGPNQKLKQICSEYKKAFDDKGINFRFHQFQKNQGRFAARYKGAQLASSKTLLYADDRNILDKNYLKNLKKSKEGVVIPNVIQENNKSLISQTLYLLRRFVYKQWGEDFKSYYITKDNFEKSSKGTTGLLVPKKLFIEVCEKMQKAASSQKSVNEDTALLKEIIDKGHKIYRSSESKVFYQSRLGLRSETRHLYERGPRFVDYYLTPGTRFFYPLVLLIVVLLASLVVLIINPVWLAYLIAVLLVVDAAMSAAISTKTSEFVRSCVAIPVIVSAFALGIAKGLVVRLAK